MDEPKDNPIGSSAIVAAVEPPATDDLLHSFLELVGAGSALPLLRAVGLADQRLHDISEMPPEAFHQFGMSPEQSTNFLHRVGQHLTDQLIEREAVEVRSLIENAGFDYSVFASVDDQSQHEILTSIKRRRPESEPGVASHAVPGHRYSFDQNSSSRSFQPEERSRQIASLTIADMEGEEVARSGGSFSQLDHAVSILADFFPSMQSDAIADMLHCMGLRLDEAVDSILEDMSSSSSKRKSSSHTSVSRLDAVRRIGATRCGDQDTDWNSVYSWISASTGQSSVNPVDSSLSSDASLDSLVAFMKVAMNVDDPTVGAEQSLQNRYNQLLSTRGPEHQLTVFSACHLAACLVDQKKYSIATPLLQVLAQVMCHVDSLFDTDSYFLQSAIRWFAMKGCGDSVSPSLLSSLGDDVVYQYACAQILYAECLIAETRANGENVALSLSSMQSRKYQSELSSCSVIGTSSSKMECESVPSSVSSNCDASCSQALICDVCDIVLVSTALCYRCVTCPDFTLCVPCHAKYEHCTLGHDFEVISSRTRVPPRSLCIANALLANVLDLQSLLVGFTSDASLKKAELCLAECYLLQRRYNESESVVREFILKNSSQYRRAHPVMFRALMCLAMCLASQLKWDESQTIFNQVLSNYDSQKGRSSAEYLNVCMQRAEYSYRRGSLLMAIPILEECHARHVAVRGKTDVSTLRCACMLGRCYAVMSDDVRAIVILNDAVTIACAAHGQTSAVAQYCRYHLGTAYFIQKSFSAALESLTPLTNSLMTPDDDNLCRAQFDIISHKAKIVVYQCLAILNRISEAITLLQEFQSAHDNTFGRQHKFYGQTLVALARAQHLSGNARAARCLFDKAVPLLTRLLGSQHYEVISANVAYASALIELQQFRVAGPLLASTHALQVQCLGESHSSTLHTMSLVSLCQSLQPDNCGLPPPQRTFRSRASSADDSTSQSSSKNSPTISVSCQLTDSEVSYWLLQQQSRDEPAVADPPRAPAPHPSTFRGAEGISTLQTIQDFGHFDDSGNSSSDFSDDS